jgi:hypothetical protein
VFNKGDFDGVVAINLELQRLAETVKQIGLKLPNSEGIKIRLFGVFRGVPQNVGANPCGRPRQAKNG